MVLIYLQLYIYMYINDEKNSICKLASPYLAFFVFFFNLEYIFDIQGFPLLRLCDYNRETCKCKCKFKQLWNLNDFRAQKEELQKRKQNPTYRSFIRRVMRMKTCDYSMVCIYICIFSRYCSKKRKEYSWEALQIGKPWLPKM